MQEFLLDNLKYLIRYPKKFSETQKYPVIIILHGAGTRGEDINKLKSNPFFELTEKHEEFPFVTIAPLCSENTWFDMWNQLKKLVVMASELNYADKNRIYLMGASMGGYATWQLAMSMPEYFAAIVPICGGGMYWNAGRLINVPVWAFHGAKDTTVFLQESVNMVDAVNKFGGSAKLTVYEDRKHDSWSDTYSNYEVFSWLLQHKNQTNKNFCDQYNKSDLYG